MLEVVVSDEEVEGERSVGGYVGSESEEGEAGEGEERGVF